MEGMESESMKEFMENLKEARKEEEIKVHNILDNNEYMDKLIEKLRMNSYVLEETSEKEKYNTYKDLSFLYKIVDNYARDNNLCPVRKNFHDIYYIKCFNYIFILYKKRSDKGITFGCYPNYAKDEDLPYIVEFEKIQKDESIIINKGLILEFKNLINKLLEEGFPLYFIQQLFDDIVDNIGEEKGNTYSKKRY